MTATLALVLHLVLLGLATWLIEALHRHIHAWRTGADSPGPGQILRDLSRMARKPAVIPAGASMLFIAAPILGCAAAALAALLIPSFATGLPTASLSDLLAVAALIGLSRAMESLAAYDTGSPVALFAGHQAGAIGLGALPVLMLVALGTTLATGGTNLDSWAALVRDGGPGAHAAGALVSLALLGLAAQETPPIPGIWSGCLAAPAALAAMLRRFATLSLAALTLVPWGLTTPAAGLESWIFGALSWSVRLLAATLLVPLLAAALPRREWLPVSALLALIAAVILGVQGAE